jgi:hypothetical protein
MGDLLKQAVADAKEVRETALANAQLVLTEAFTPQLQSMLSRKLQAEMDDIDDEDLDDVEDGEDEFDDTDSENTNETKAKYGEVVSEEEDLDDEEDASDVDGLGDEEAVDDFEDGEEEVEDDGLDLDEIIAELEAALSGDDEEEDDLDADADGDVDIADLGGDDSEADAFGGDDEEDEDELDLDEILRALEEMEQVDEEKEGEAELNDLRAENKELKASVTEHRDVVIFLKDKINEVNLLNAKLLFSNKLFRAFNMTNEQKRRVLESLDRTKNTREVKLVYSTLAESLSHSTTTTKRHTKITEGMASRAVKSTKPNTSVSADDDSTRVINESSAYARMVELANIKR